MLLIRNTKGKSTKKDAAYLFGNVYYSEDKRDEWLQCFMREIWLYRECVDYDSETDIYDYLYVNFKT